MSASHWTAVVARNAGVSTRKPLWQMGPLVFLVLTGAYHSQLPYRHLFATTDQNGHVDLQD